jgi:Domain of unknown function (DUF1707)
MSADSPASGGPPEVRASDTDRDRVLDQLRTAVGDGRLTADEFEERMEAALSARTLGALAVLTADLGHPGTEAALATGMGAARAEEVIRIDQKGGSVQRTGQWLVPRRLELRSSWSDVTLDFTEAVIVEDLLVVEVDMRGGALVMVTRPGVVVDAGSLRVRYTDVDVRSGGEPGVPVVLRVRLTGRMKYGSVEVRA